MTVVAQQPAVASTASTASNNASNNANNNSQKWPTAPQFLAYVLMLHAFIYTAPWQQLLPAPAPAISQPPTAAAVATADSNFAAMAALVEPHGYQLEQHFVTTADGFILRLFRIPGRVLAASQTAGSPPPACASNPLFAANRNLSTHINSNNSSSPYSPAAAASQRPVVFLQHALMDSSAGWLLLGQQSLALQCAARGFDVWLGNARGNRYSRNHTTLLPTQPAFWAWSWQQQAEYDLPASIEHVLATTQQQRLVYVGYSQGAMTALAALSTQPQLASSISLAILLAPVAFTTAMTSPAFVLSSRLGLDTYGLRSGWTEWGSHQPYWGRVCGVVPQLCLHFLTAFCGRNPTGNVDPELIPRIFQHLPAGSSVFNMNHWGQGIRRRDTQHLYAFDYGSDCSSPGSSPSPQPLHSDTLSAPGGSCGGGRASNSHCSISSSTPQCNMQAYEQDSPPFYDMSAITTPLALFSGGQDTISTLPDVELLKRKLSPGILQQHVHIPEYAHLDFELGSDAPYVLYPSLLALARRFSSMV